jgi:hypothetical protein
VKEKNQGSLIAKIEHLMLPDFANKKTSYFIWVLFAWKMWSQDIFKA